MKIQFAGAYHFEKIQSVKELINEGREMRFPIEAGVEDEA